MGNLTRFAGSCTSYGHSIKATAAWLADPAKAGKRSLEVGGYCEPPRKLLSAAVIDGSGQWNTEADELDHPKLRNLVVGKRPMGCNMFRWLRPA
jgi:hypothetical protein